MTKYLVHALLACALFGCIEYELPVEARPAGEAEVHTASIGDAYEQRIFTVWWTGLLSLPIPNWTGASDSNPGKKG